MTAAELYRRLYAAYGQPRWWSSEPYTVMVQAVLVQNTAWPSVQRVTEAMPAPLTPDWVNSLEKEALEDMIRPCGFCRGKAAAIRRLTEWYRSYGYSPEAVGAAGLERLRRELLAVKGVGAETADVILVYGFHQPTFVIDAYTRRFLQRLGFAFGGDGEIRGFFEGGLERDAQLYGWYHWLLLTHGIQHCKKTPLCGGCPFAGECPRG